MSFWKRVKSWFAGADGPESFDRELQARMEAALSQLIDRGETFTPIGVVNQLVGYKADQSVKDELLELLEALYQDGYFEARSYDRSQVGTLASSVAYHPRGTLPASSPPPPAASWSQHPPQPSTPPLAAAVSQTPAGRTLKKAKRLNPYDDGGTLTLSPDQLRERALKIRPWATAWIGRVDVIPPTSDERTALVDRGLVLRGFFTQAQIDEFHRIGDLWLEHADTDRLARARAHKNADAAMAQMRKEAAEKKEQKRKEAAERRAKRAEEIAKRKRSDIIFAGEGVSGRLGDRRCNVEKLQSLGLPVLATPGDLAAQLQLEVPQLRWLCFHSEASRSTHYRQFRVPKRSGGERILASPKPNLRAAQRWVLDEILNRVPLESAAHGFVSGRSTATCARPHCAQDVVINLDLEDFFPTITFGRVRGLFESFGYSPAASTLLALLCTESPRRQVTYAGTAYHVAIGPRCLPQGACTSPALSNLICRRLDRRLQGLSAKSGYRYTRYADDLTISLPKGHRDDVPMLLARVRHIVQEEGFVVHPTKGRVQRPGGRQTVTGIVVNHPTKISLPRRERRLLRAILHNAKKTGLPAQNRNGHPDFAAHLRGKIAYLAMIDPAAARPLRQQLDQLENKSAAPPR